jgi:hypothetical protein
LIFQTVEVSSHISLSSVESPILFALELESKYVIVKNGCGIVVCVLKYLTSVLTGNKEILST